MSDDRDVEDEIRFHIERATEENLAKGLSRADARAEALARFGDPERVRRECLAMRGRTVRPALAWTGIAALAVASFFAGYGLRDPQTPSSPLPPTVRVVNWDVTTPGPRGRLLTAFAPSAPTVSAISEFQLAKPPLSPFQGWRWREGVPEVMVEDGGWYALVSAAGVPAATLREDLRKAQGLPAGKYLDGDPFEMIAGNRKCRGDGVSIRLRSLEDGGEIFMACEGGWKRTKVLPRSKWPKEEDGKEAEPGPK